MQYTPETCLDVSSKSTVDPSDFNSARLTQPRITNHPALPYFGYSQASATVLADWKSSNSCAAYVAVMARFVNTNATLSLSLS